MTAEKIDGTAIADAIVARVAEAVKALPAQPTLAVVLVGDDPASQIYVRSKLKDTEGAGMRSIGVRLTAETSEADVIAHVKTLSEDPSVDGILVQLPMPQHIDENRVLAALDPAKDVDGLTDISAGRLVLGKQGLRPCTPVGSVILAKSVEKDLSGAHCVVLGRSILVGKPASLLFQYENCTVTMAHSRTRDLAALCRSADVLVPAIGKPEFVRGDWIKPGAIVIDVGINRVPSIKNPGKTRIVGDVAYKEALEVARAVTPVPGGVGPMTRACLLRNTVLAACARRGFAVPDALNG